MDGINVHDASMVNGTAGKSGPEVYPSPTPKGSFVNLGVERKYAGKESDLLEKQNKLDQQRTELNNKYKLPERQFANHQSDEKRKSEFLKKEKELADRQSNWIKTSRNWPHVTKLTPNEGRAGTGIAYSNAPPAACLRVTDA